MNQHTVSSFHHRVPTPPHRLLKRTTKYLPNHKITHGPTCTTPDLPPTLPAPLALCKRIHSKKYPTVKSSYQLRTCHVPSFLNKTHTQKPAASCHTLYTILPPFSFPPAPTQCAALQLKHPMHSLTRSSASSCIDAHILCGNIR